MSASEKIFSIFEPHTDMIKRGKVNQPVEFGHKVFLAESRLSLLVAEQEQQVTRVACGFASTVLFDFSLQELVSNGLQGYRIPDVISGHLSGRAFKSTIYGSAMVELRLLY